MNNNNFNLIEHINNLIIEKIENGVNPWRKPWITLNDGTKTNKPHNYITNKAYYGINACLLEPGYYMTMKECNDLGGKIKKGAKSYIVVFPLSKTYKDFKINDNEQLEEIEKSYFKLLYYRVFKLEDCENIREIKRRKKYNDNFNAEPTAEEIIKQYQDIENISIFNHNQDRAYYSPSADYIVLPLKKQFKSEPEYYSTAFHEIAHSTGHEKRLNRLNDMAEFGNEEYSKEELIAEITSTYATSYLNISNEQTLNNSCAYLKGWANKLKNNTASWFIMNATTQAEKAFNYIFKFENLETSAC